MSSSRVVPETLETEDPVSVLTRVYEKEKQHKTADALDILYDYSDNSFHAGKFENVNVMLETADLTQLSISAGLTLLTVRRWARQHLPAEAAFYARFRQHLLQIEPQDRVDRLLQGLE